MNEQIKSLTWHAPGLGEVHSEDHEFLIFCEQSDDEADFACDDLAREVCRALNFKKPTDQQIMELAKKSGFKLFGTRIIAADGGSSGEAGASLRRFVEELFKSMDVPRDDTSGTLSEE